MAWKPKYPHIVANLTECDGNALSIIACVTTALKASGVGVIEIRQFVEDAMSGNYEQLLHTVFQWVDVE